jgi:hypothetical protein
MVEILLAVIAACLLFGSVRHKHLWCASDRTYGLFNHSVGWQALPREFGIGRTVQLVPP